MIVEVPDAQFKGLVVDPAMEQRPTALVVCDRAIVVPLRNVEMDERFQRKGIRIELLVARRRKKSEAPVLLKLGSLPVGQIFSRELGQECPGGSSLRKR